MHIIWFLMMQNGITTSIKPQQVTFIVPGAENFEPTEISDFVQKAQDNLVGSFLLFLKELFSCYLIKRQNIEFSTRFRIMIDFLSATDRTQHYLNLHGMSLLKKTNP